MAITNKEINLYQLTEELGGLGLIADFTNPDEKIILPAENVELTEKDLEIAISKHIARNIELEKANARKEILMKLGLTQEEVALLIG